LKNAYANSTQSLRQPCKKNTESNIQFKPCNNPFMLKKKVAHLQAQIRQSAAPAGVINQPHGRPPKSPKNAATPRGGHHGSWGRQLCHLHGQKNGVTMKTGNFT